MNIERKNGMEQNRIALWPNVKNEYWADKKRISFYESEETVTFEHGQPLAIDGVWDVAFVHRIKYDTPENLWSDF